MAFFFISDVETLAELHQKKTRHGVLRETEDSDAAVLDAVVDQNSGSVSLRNDLHSNPLHSFKKKTSITNVAGSQ